MMILIVLIQWKKENLTVISMIQTQPGDSYLGGKGSSGTYQKIINQFPPHDSFFSLFAGKCYVTRNKKPANKINWLMDINPDIVKYWNSLILPANYKVSEGDAIILLNSLVNGYLQQSSPNIVKNSDTVLIYLDPPYLPETRKSRNRYPFELDKNDHIKILKAINKLTEQKFLIAISHYQCELYDKYLSHWRRIDFNSMKRGGVEIESLYMNYPEPTELHQYNYLGDDYREREKIQNQIKRNVQRLKNMPPLLQNAIVTAIKENF